MTEVSILCLVHNNLLVTKKFVDCIFSNTSSIDFELFFLDNGSTDSVSDFLKNGAKEKKWKLVNQTENIGIIKGRNILLEKTLQSRSKYVLNIDNDQHVQPGWIESLISKAEQGNHIVGVEAWCMYPPNCGGSVQIGTENLSTKAYFPFKRCSKKGEPFTYIGCGGTLIQKEVINKIGLFDENFSPAYFEDPDMAFRAIQNNFNLSWAFDCPIIHLAHQTVGAQLLFNKQQQFIKSWKYFTAKWSPFFPKPIME